ncbi:type I-B CRISPR-associated protein Cas7/Cst2/DevR [Xanthocytophaga agilis]|uniref:Type I-B CRISPR-associated protein Cas7/Cst2/DevR n=1 Tax=Xanthocytophaga agilis TaxID=3048010 RepID=A0AAE3UCL4_9BACT|nr:type I-B CRISPR-associated protein Cas7/Cst2/DevR [Xanthocytophaga agilis]MDJ1500205.1 type I-B CRISPR-associated protein Cas7/Cst2/DevR [Xanthocytophaga agilis]
MNLKTQGFILLDVDVVALNNAGKSTTSNFDNAVATKKINKNGRTYTYVSGQAWRYWWRDALQKNHQWLLSPITRDNKIAFTAANPVQYADDDVFGFMKAAKDIVRDEQGNPVLDTKGKEKKEDVTVTRVSPLKNSAIISVGSVRTAENWSSMARQEGDSVPYSKEEYSAIMKGMFSLDLAQVGTFATYNKTGFKNLTEDLKKTALQNGSKEIDDLFVKDSKGNAQKLVQLPKETRIKRITDTIKALKTISGGAMQTDNMGDVTPKFIILATMTTGNHPFSHVAINDGVNNDRVLLNVEGIEEVLNDYKDQFEGTVFIGRRSGFMEEYKSDLEKLSEKFSNVKLHSINEAIDLYCSQLETQLN